MTDKITIEVPGEPVAKGRGRIGKVGNRAMIFTPTKTRRAEADIKWYAAQVMAGRPPLEGPIVVSVKVYRAKGMPKSRRGRADAEAGLVVPVTKPDGDNYLKAAADGCSGVLYRDDALAAVKVVQKFYSVRPRLVIEVWRWTPGWMGEL